MLQPSTLQFLKELKKNNNKEWFDKNRKKYEAAKADFAQLAEKVIAQLSKTDKTIAHLKPKDCLFRINRDIRFSKDKSPYKTNFGMSIAKKGKKGISAGYYLHCEPGHSFIGGGLWMPMSPDLNKVRQEIDYCWDEFKKILIYKKFKSTFGELKKDEGMALSRPPKGYNDDNPAIEYLKLKHFIATKPLTDKDFQNKDLAKNVVNTFQTLQPLLDFINRAIEG